MISTLHWRTFAVAKKGLQAHYSGLEATGGMTVRSVVPPSNVISYEFVFTTLYVALQFTSANLPFSPTSRRTYGMPRLYSCLAGLRV